MEVYIGGAGVQSCRVSYSHILYCRTEHNGAAMTWSVRWPSLGAEGGGGSPNPNPHSSHNLLIQWHDQKSIHTVPCTYLCRPVTQQTLQPSLTK